MPTMDGDSDSDCAPEEITFEQGSKKDEKIREAQRENKERVAREKKERRRLWAQRKTQREPPNKDVQEAAKDNDDQHAGDVTGMLPSNIVSFLASREKQLFSSDSEKETIENEPGPKKKKQKKRRLQGTNAVLLKNLPPPQCAQNSLDFLKRRKAQVPRSQAILTNADRALRFLSSRGSVLSKS